MSTPESAATPVPSGPVDLDDDAAVAHWLDRFGVTREQLVEAVGAAGTDPAAIAEHLLNQGSSAGAG